MIRFHLKELIARREFEQRRRITLEQVARDTGIHRTTLSKIAAARPYNTSTDNIEAICRYLNCQVGELVEIVDENSRPSSARKKQASSR
jgi:putative transcriptional regulator